MWIYVVLGTWNAFCVGSENGFFSDLAPGTGTFLGACVLFPEMWTGTAYAPSVGSGCDCDPFGILLQYKSTRKRLCNNFREGGNRAFTADWETIKRLARVPASKEGTLPQPDTASSEPRCSVEKTELSSLLLQPLFPGGFTIFSPVFRGGH